ncbi:MAG: hypothetical protein ACYTG7_06095 [Planctomycetota bacterium]
MALHTLRRSHPHVKGGILLFLSGCNNGIAVTDLSRPPEPVKADEQHASDEVVIHMGEARGDHTLIWQRNLSRPRKIEYFHETVEDRLYVIRGWGYYGEDDPDLAPKTWFHGRYVRDE